MIKTLPNWYSALAKAGYAAKGIVYFTIGFMAFLGAIGKGGDLLGASGALAEISQQPYGPALLIIVGIGLLAYSIYRLAGGILDAENEGSDGSGAAKRVGYFTSGLVYGALGIGALTGLSSESADNEEAITAKVLSMPGGMILISLVGAAIITAGIFQWVKAAKGSYKSKFSFDTYATGKRDWIEKASKFGLISRGLIFTIIGGFLIVAALQTDPSETKGLGEALGKISEQNFGSILLGAVALGLICYSIYCAVLALYGNFRKRA